MECYVLDRQLQYKYCWILPTRAGRLGGRLRGYAGGNPGFGDRVTVYLRRRRPAHIHERPMRRGLYHHMAASACSSRTSQGDLTMIRYWS